ncbi:hypothetical protein Pint_17707 [Pistacia integerrima]|uniref:Uncharacterized protein n=1 Tax=Pistacia integerrima TaxID=434235 RepID=A0ACC0YY10_9ROSI|nr:hypothetical protein Pint_17707 [Pistacia integerrima]
MPLLTIFFFFCSCLDALRHPFLCGPRWRVVPSMDMIRWGLGSTAVRITEEYIYHQPQSPAANFSFHHQSVGRSHTTSAIFSGIRVSFSCWIDIPYLQGPLLAHAKLVLGLHFIELMEILNPHSKPKNWLEFLPGKWRLLYCTGRHIGLTVRQPPARVLLGDVHLTIVRATKANTSLLLTSDIGFGVMMGQDWPHDKTGITGKMEINSLFRLTAGRRLYLEEEKTTGRLSLSQSNARNSLVQKLSGSRWKKALPFKDIPSSLPVVKLVSGDIEVTMSLDDPLNQNVDTARNVVQEVQTQVPPEMFDLAKFVCGTYVDSRLLVLRGVNGSALLFTRSPVNESCR